MTLDGYIDRYGINLDDLVRQVIKRLPDMDPQRVRQLQAAVGSGRTSDTPQVYADLVIEASENLNLARRLRDMVQNDNGDLTGSVTDVQRALQAADRALATASKRWQDIYNTSSFKAVEDCVKDVLAEVDPETFDRFTTLLEERLSYLQ